MLTEDTDLARDIVQDVLVKAFRRWHRIGAPPRPHAYVRRMVVNELTSWRRKWARQVPSPDGGLDTIRVGTGCLAFWDQRDEIEFVYVQLPGSTHATIAAFAESSGFDATRVGNPIPTHVNGAAALFGDVSIWPPNGEPDPSTGKQDGAVPTVAWQLPDSGVWVAVQTDGPKIATVDDLASSAASLEITSNQPRASR